MGTASDTLTFDFLIAFSLAVLPVLLFLLALVWVDTYRLVRRRVVLETLLVGAAAGTSAFLINVSLFSAGLVESASYSRYGSPFVEEGLKALFLIYLIRSNRVGFLVDAGILGFAVGSGFAVVENLYYLFSFPAAGPLVWMVRGCGTAMMHGACAAIFAILAKLLWRRRESWRAWVPGLAAATGIHSFFNHFFISPLASAVVILLSLPLLTLFTFSSSERSLRRWLGAGFDHHARLLELIHSGEFRASRVGLYLQALKEHFGPEAVVDMLCYARLTAELSMRAKGILLARRQGFEVLPDARVREKLEELRVLETSIGATGKLALKPVLGTTPEDVWQLLWLGD